MLSVVRSLRAVTEQQAMAKWRRLREVRDAFVFRRGSSFERPSAAEHILAGACRAARRFSDAGGTGREAVLADARRGRPKANMEELLRCSLGDGPDWRGRRGIA
eukprot:1836472-Prymnesium_polylepis.1